MSTYGPRTRDAKALQGVALPRRAMIALAAAVAIAAPMAPAGAGSSQTVLLSVTHSISEVAAQVGALGGRVLQSMPIADAMLVELPAGRIPTGATVLTDVPMKVNGTRTYFTTDTPSYRETIAASTTADGSGVTVALVDTGVADVPGLEGVSHVNVTDGPQGDGYGHGTFLAGLIGGRGQFPGVAPGAQILDIQVAAADGGTSLSLVLKGLQAVADDGTAKVLNISLSTDSPIPPQFDPLTTALDRLWRNGVTVITAAGNNGPARNTVGSPGTDPLLITAGALDEKATASRDDDTVADFSSRGGKYGSAKPDLVAPGVSLISSRSPGSLADVGNPGSVVGSDYFRGSGTSMSAAVIAGAAAAVLGVNANLTPNGVKAVLTSTTYTSRDLGKNDGAGAGALDLGAALTAASVSVGDPGSATPAAGSKWGPEEADEAAWAAFAAAWEAGDFEAVKAAWKALAPRTQVWGARMFALATVAGSLNSADFEARGWAARGWAARGWAARGWAADEWLARGWAARGWAARGWAARGWAARGWATEDWAARGWAARGWAARGWADEEWAARGWAEYLWDARGWAARGWAGGVWAGGLAG